ncbi:hypothetical protein FKW77_009909 [Venturia effusa]|uniref:F-box domain-containing protein n=1 Tax=Venturia effusa TaxID=50376 RepID=A0A517L490_9PEZI|nr:hypothetical protein FKW77_009909 [Venturia effusa]
MVKLDEISTELLLNVVSFLSQVDILNLSLTNKQVRHATEPELYREYTNTGGQMHGRDLKPFLRRIIDSPELARYVHYLDLKGWTTMIELDPRCGDLTGIPLTVEEYDYFTRAAYAAKVISIIREFDSNSNMIDRANALVDHDHIDEPVPGWADFLYGPDTHIDEVPFDNKFCQLLQAGIAEPLYVLLFALLPNVRHISLRSGHAHGQNFHLFPHLKPEHQFSGLRRLTVGANNNMSEWPLSSVGSLFHSQTLRTVECFMTGEWERESCGDPWEHRPPLTPLAPRSLTITRLMLQKAAFSAKGVRNILAACQSLRSLYYSAGGKNIGPENFACEELVEALSPHKTSLESLELDLYSGWDYATARPGCISDLSEFTALQKLVLTNEVVALWDEMDVAISTPELCNMFPASLRFLQFQIYWQIDMQKQIEEMLAMRSDKFSNLEKLILTVDEPGSYSWDRRVASFFAETMQLCEEARVELEVTTVEENYKRTFFEYWGLNHIWHDIRLKDGKYVREEKRPKTAEEMRQAVAAFLTPEQLETFERTFEQVQEQLAEQEANYGWETDYSDEIDSDEEVYGFFDIDDSDDEDEDEDEEEDPDMPALE